MNTLTNDDSYVDITSDDAQIDFSEVTGAPEPEQEEYTPVDLSEAYDSDESARYLGVAGEAGRRAEAAEIRGEDIFGARGMSERLGEVGRASSYGWIGEFASGAARGTVQTGRGIVNTFEKLADATGAAQAEQFFNSLKLESDIYYGSRRGGILGSPANASGLEFVSGIVGEQVPIIAAIISSSMITAGTSAALKIGIAGTKAIGTAGMMTTMSAMTFGDNMDGINAASGGRLDERQVFGLAAVSTLTQSALEAVIGPEALIGKVTTLSALKNSKALLSELFAAAKKKGFASTTKEFAANIFAESGTEAAQSIVQSLWEDYAEGPGRTIGKEEFKQAMTEALYAIPTSALFGGFAALAEHQVKSGIIKRHNSTESNKEIVTSGMAKDKIVAYHAAVDEIYTKRITEPLTAKFGAKDAASIAEVMKEVGYHYAANGGGGPESYVDTFEIIISETNLTPAQIRQLDSLKTEEEKFAWMRKNVQGIREHEADQTDYFRARGVDAQYEHESKIYKDLSGKDFVPTEVVETEEDADAKASRMNEESEKIKPSETAKIVQSTHAEALRRLYELRQETMMLLNDIKVTDRDTYRRVTIATKNMADSMIQSLMNPNTDSSWINPQAMRETLINMLYINNGVARDDATARVMNLNQADLQSYFMITALENDPDGFFTGPEIKDAVAILSKNKEAWSNMVLTDRSQEQHETLLLIAEEAGVSDEQRVELVLAHAHKIAGNWRTITAYRTEKSESTATIDGPLSEIEAKAFEIIQLVENGAGADEIMRATAELEDQLAEMDVQEQAMLPAIAKDLEMNMGFNPEEQSPHSFIMNRMLESSNDRKIFAHYDIDAKRAIFYKNATAEDVLHEWFHHVDLNNLLPDAMRVQMEAAYGITKKSTLAERVAYHEKAARDFVNYLKIEADTGQIGIDYPEDMKEAFEYLGAVFSEEFHARAGTILMAPQADVAPVAPEIITAFEANEHLNPFTDKAVVLAHYQEASPDSFVGPDGKPLPNPEEIADELYNKEVDAFVAEMAEKHEMSDEDVMQNFRDAASQNGSYIPQVDGAQLESSTGTIEGFHGGEVDQDFRSSGGGVWVSDSSADSAVKVGERSARKFTRGGATKRIKFEIQNPVPNTIGNPSPVDIIKYIEDGYDGIVIKGGGYNNEDHYILFPNTNVEIIGETQNGKSVAITRKLAASAVMESASTIEKARNSRRQQLSERVKALPISNDNITFDQKNKSFILDVLANKQTRLDLGDRLIPETREALAQINASEELKGEVESILKPDQTELFSDNTFVYEPKVQAFFEGAFKNATVEEHHKTLAKVLGQSLKDSPPVTESGMIESQSAAQTTDRVVLNRRANTGGHDAFNRRAKTVMGTKAYEAWDRKINSLPIEQLQEIAELAEKETAAKEAKTGAKTRKEGEYRTDELNDLAEILFEGRQYSELNESERKSVQSQLSKAYANAAKGLVIDTAKKNAVRGALSNTLLTFARYTDSLVKMGTTKVNNADTSGGAGVTFKNRFISGIADTFKTGNAWLESHASSFDGFMTWMDKGDPNGWFNINIGAPLHAITNDHAARKIESNWWVLEDEKATGATVQRHDWNKKFWFSGQKFTLGQAIGAYMYTDRGRSTADKKALFGSNAELFGKNPDSVLNEIFIFLDGGGKKGDGKKGYVRYVKARADGGFLYSSVPKEGYEKTAPAKNFMKAEMIMMKRYHKILDAKHFERTGKHLGDQMKAVVNKDGSTYQRKYFMPGMRKGQMWARGSSMNDIFVADETVREQLIEERFPGKTYDQLEPDQQFEINLAEDNHAQAKGIRPSKSKGVKGGKVGFVETKKYGAVGAEFILDASNVFQSYREQADIYRSKVKTLDYLDSIVKDPGFTHNMRKLFGTIEADIYQNAIITMLHRERFVNGKIYADSVADRVIGDLKGMATLSILGARISSMALQTASGLRVLGEIPVRDWPRYAANSAKVIKEVVGNTHRIADVLLSRHNVFADGEVGAMFDRMMKHNPYIINRMADPDLQDRVASRQRRRGAGAIPLGQGTLADVLMGGFRVADMGTVITTYTTAYEAKVRELSSLSAHDGKKMNDEQIEIAANEFAATIVDSTQPASGTSQRNLMQTEREAVKVLYPFTGDTMVQFQYIRHNIIHPIVRGIRDGGVKGGVDALMNGKFGRTAPGKRLLFSALLPMTFVSMIRRRRRPENEKEWAEDMMAYSLSVIPIIGPIMSNAILSGFASSENIAIAPFVNIVKSGIEICKGEELKAVDKFFRGVSGMTGFPQVFAPWVKACCETILDSPDVNAEDKSRVEAYLDLLSLSIAPLPSEEE